MTETTGSVKQCVIANTITLTDTYQQLYSTPIYNSTVQLSMIDDNSATNVGSVFLIISGGVAKNIVFTGGVGFSGSTDLVMTPFSYNVTIPTSNYTVWFEYTDNKIQVACNTQDPSTTITFIGSFTSATDSLPLNVLAVDKLVENTANAGIVFDDKVVMNNGVINIGTSSNTADDINIATNSSSGGRTLTLGNTVAGSKIVLTGPIETPNPSVDTITFNDSAAITWTDVSSTAQRIGKICHVVVKANMSAESNVVKGELHNFFTISPSNKYNTNYVVTGTAIDTETNDIGAVCSVSNSSNFKIIVPRSQDMGESTTITASVMYIST